LIKHNRLTLPFDEHGKEDESACPDFWKKNEKLFKELQYLIKDLKLCGQSDYRQLIKWRTMVREHITKNELREQNQKLSLETSKDHISGPLDPEKMKEMKEKELKVIEKKEKKRKKDFEKKFKAMIDTSAHMDHFRQDEDVF